MPRRRFALTALLLLAPLVAGCVVEQRYLVEARDLRGVALVEPKQRGRAALRAVRSDDGESVLLHVPYLPAGLQVAPEVPDDALVAVPTRAVNTRLTVGEALAGAGALFAGGAIAAFLQGERDYRQCVAQAGWFCDLGRDMSRAAGVSFSIGAAGQILAGSVLMVNAAGRHPQEVPVGTPIFLVPPAPPSRPPPEAPLSVPSAPAATTPRPATPAPSEAPAPPLARGAPRE